MFMGDAVTLQQGTSSHTNEPLCILNGHQGCQKELGDSDTNVYELVSNISWLYNYIGHHVPHSVIHLVGVKLAYRKM
jgi:hypothetical protein